MIIGPYSRACRASNSRGTSTDSTPFPFRLHSRLKKIKCVQVKAQPRCEACETGNTSCQFRDRERYFAERSRIVTGASAASSPSHSRRSSSSQGMEHSGLPPTARGDSIDASGWYSGARTSSDSSHPSRYASSSPSYSLSSSPQSNPDQWFSSPLIESARPHYDRWVLRSSLPPSSPTGFTWALADSSHVSGNLRTHRPYLKSETARPAPTTLITPFRMRQARSVTALLRAKHCHCLTLVTAPCPTRRCSCISYRSSLSAFRATFPSSNTTMYPAACSMAHCHHSWPIA